MELKKYLERIDMTDQKAMSEAAVHWSHVAKPLNSLGVLEEIIVKIAGISKKSQINIRKKALIIMCADNGVTEEGITQTGQEVTAIVTENFTMGNSCVCIMAQRAGVDVYPVDIGVARDICQGEDFNQMRHPLVRAKISYGTKNFRYTCAMTKDQVEAAIIQGIELTGKLVEQGYGFIATGEMGIGNTTTSSAVASVLLGCDVKLVTGKGAGLSESGYQKKIKIIQDAIEYHHPDKKDAIDVLAKVGGLDLAGLTGVFIGGAVWGVPVLVDGFISASAALAASVLCPLVLDYMIASHVSAEPAGALILERLGLKPFIHAEMCLGEGTGAIAAIPLLDMACDIYETMSTFEDIQVEEYQILS